MYEVQAVLKRDHGGKLDKYRVKGALRWKTAVGVSGGAREQSAAAGRTPRPPTLACPVAYQSLLIRVLQEVLKDHPDLFEKVDKTPGGKHVWHLRDADAGAA